MGWFNKKEHWITPSSNILLPVVDDNGEDANTMEETFKTLHEAIKEHGISIDPVGYRITPNAVQFIWNLSNLKDYRKLNGTIPAIEARTREEKMFLSKSKHGDFAITLPRVNRALVSLRQCIETEDFISSVEKSSLTAALGFDEENNVVAIDLAKMPHLLIAGTTGSGKSIAIHDILISILMHSSPADVQMIMIDPKQIELSMYAGLPHLVKPIITDVDQSTDVLNEICAEMDKRYSDIKQGKKDHPKLLVVVDELADLMLSSGKAVETPLVRIAQLGRAAGIHLIVATQRPMATVITGLIKANMPGRLALTMKSQYDSKIMDVEGAHKLSSRGDALFQSGDNTKPTQRLQCAFTRDEDIAAVVNWWKYPKQGKSKQWDVEEIKAHFGV